MWKWQRCTQIPFHQQNIPHSPGPRPPMLHCWLYPDWDTRNMIGRVQYHHGYNQDSPWGKTREMGIKQVPSGICVPFTNEEHGKSKQGHVLRTSSGSVVTSGQAEAETRMTRSEPCCRGAGRIEDYDCQHPQHIWADRWERTGKHGPWGQISGPGESDERWFGFHCLLKHSIDNHCTTNFSQRSSGSVYPQCWLVLLHTSFLTAQDQTVQF